MPLSSNGKVHRMLDSNTVDSVMEENEERRIHDGQTSTLVSERDTI